MKNRMPSLAAMDRAAKVCAALAERERRDGDIPNAEALEKAGNICAGKAMVGAVFLAHKRGYIGLNS